MQLLFTASRFSERTPICRMSRKKQNQKNVAQSRQQQKHTNANKKGKRNGKCCQEKEKNLVKVWVGNT